MSIRYPSKFFLDWILPATWMIAFVSGTAIIVRSPFRELKRDLNELNTSLDELETGLNKLETDLNELNIYLNKLETKGGTVKRAFEDGVLPSVKDANAGESREVSAERKMQGRLLRAIINLKTRELDGESVIQRIDRLSAMDVFLEAKR